MTELTKYQILHLRTISEVQHGMAGVNPTMREVPVEAWVQVAEVETDGTAWLVVEHWFNELPEQEKRAGRYRLMRQSDGYAGGTFEDYDVNPTWQVDPAPKPEPAEAVA